MSGLRRLHPRAAPRLWLGTSGPRRWPGKRVALASSWRSAAPSAVQLLSSTRRTDGRLRAKLAAARRGRAPRRKPRWSLRIEVPWQPRNKGRPRMAGPWLQKAVPDATCGKNTEARDASAPPLVSRPFFFSESFLRPAGKQSPQIKKSVAYPALTGSKCSAVRIPPRSTSLP